MAIRQWDQVLSTDETNLLCQELALSLTRRISDEKTRYMLYEKIELLDLHWFCEYEISYSDMILLPEDVRLLSQVLALFQKRADIDLQIDKSAVAYEKFVASERRCSDTNECFRKWGAGMFQFHPSVERVLHTAQRKISSLLRDVPDVSELRPRFGPGATTQVQKRMASAREKLSQTLACSEDFVQLLETHLEEVPQWVPFTEDSDVALVTVEIHHGRLSFVPKNAKTDRSIVVEPSLNSFFQLGYGDYIADRLRTRGVDIRDQTRNQILAREGSIDGELATLDLSSASDTISTELVAHLLPIDWFNRLSALRTSRITHDGKTMKLQKFSSMGNGFTFPLETLIFWALSVSCIDESKGEVVSVYGDDIIVPAHRVPLLHAVLSACGFVLNKHKSFWSGPFRESCGKDYHSGLLVRPVFLKDRLSGESAFILHNFFVRHGDFESAHLVHSWLHKDCTLYGPDGYGDGHLLTTNDYEDLYEKRRNPKWVGWCGYTFDTYTWKGRKSFRPLPGDYVYPAYSIYLKEGRNCPLTTADRGLLAHLTRLGKLKFLRIFGEEVYLDLIERLKNLSSDSVPYDKRTSSFGVSLPGTRGYKRISIYTLIV